MPNGGSDCCATCWFNKKNKGEAGYAHTKDPGEDRCEIRDLVIPVPGAFFTYCANHPHHNPDRIRIPIGPVYTLDEDHHPGGFLPGPRKVWAESPDTEEIRRELICLLGAIPERPLPEYPTATKRDDEVIRQLGTWQDRRAVSGLRRILSFHPDANTSHVKSGFSGEAIFDTAGVPYRRDRRPTIGLALESLAKILGDEALDDIERVYRSASERRLWLSRLWRRREDRDAVQRYCALMALAHCSSTRAKHLLEEASWDPNRGVSSQAKEMLATR